MSLFQCSTLWVGNPIARREGSQWHNGPQIVLKGDWARFSPTFHILLLIVAAIDTANMD